MARAIITIGFDVDKADTVEKLRRELHAHARGTDGVQDVESTLAVDQTLATEDLDT